MVLGICARVMCDFGGCPMVVVYSNSKDHPGKFAARLWNITGDKEPVATEVIIVRDSLAEIRQEIPKGFIRVLPDLHDDPVISEIWL